MTKNNIEIFLKYYFPVLFWMGLIFGFSSMEGGPLRGEADLWFYVERKGAHIFEYATLTILIARVLLRKIESKKDLLLRLVLSGTIAFFYAISDEIHQSFVFGREGKSLDVGIDSIGILIAISLLAIVYKNKKLSK